ncbi:MAG TPA: hypothetical protein ENI42_02260, partial [Thermoplasmatales archaeon]|nr:hypothetical protein [Thermoplasmatales archaeon]
MVDEDIDVGLILKKAFQTVFHDTGYIGIYFIPAMVGLVMLLLMQHVTGFNPFLMFQNLQPSSTAMTVLTDRMEVFITMLILYVVSVGVTGLIALAAATIKIDRHEKKVTISIGEAFR